MPAYNFRPRFADAVRSGRKRQTIRHKRQRPTKAGDRLMLYTGQRTKHCQLLRATFCKNAEPVDIYSDRVVLAGRVLRGHRVLRGPELLAFARADGFESAEELLLFFGQLYGLPLVGEMEVIRWY